MHNAADYTEDLSEMVAMAFAPLQAFAQMMEAITDKGVTVHPYDTGVVASALVDYSERRLAAALAVIEDKVGHIAISFDGNTNSIADNVVDAALSPAPKKKPRGSAEDEVHHV